MASGGVWPIQALFATMLNINLFQYLAAFITIVLAIALTDLLGSLHRLIIARHRVRWSVLPLLAAGFVFVSVLSEFFSIWVGADVARVSFLYLLLLVFISSTIALAAFAALPDEVPPEGLDLGEAYMANHAYLYGVLAIGFAGDPLRTMFHYYMVHGAYPWLGPAYWIPALGVEACFVLLAWSGNRRVHVIGLIAVWTICSINYLTWAVG